MKQERYIRTIKMMTNYFLRIREALESTMVKEREENRRFLELDQCLRQQDALMSELKVSLRAMIEKLRPIKLTDQRPELPSEATPHPHNTSIFKVRAQKIIYTSAFSLRLLPHNNIP